MNKIVIFLIFIILITNGCSLNKNSKFWTKSKKIPEEKNSDYKEILFKEEAIIKEFNPNISINLGSIISNNFKIRNFFNNDGRLKYNGEVKKSSRYKISKIKNFYQFEPQISFEGKNIIFFDNKGSVLKFDEKSKLIWKKNYYSKPEKKLNPILQFANDGNTLVVADNIAKYYALNLSNGKILWSKINQAPFNSQIKIYNNKFFIIDFSNTLRCFSLKDGKELWNIKTEKLLIRSQKKLSMVIVNDLLYFKNSIGDISAVDIDEGELLWQLTTQSSLINEENFTLETSDLVTDGRTLFFSNNRNQFFSIDLETASFNWENNVNSNLRPTLIENFLISVSLEGYLVVIDRITGNIIKVTDIFDNFNPKKRDKISPTGFIVGLKSIYLSTNIGKLLVIDIKSGKTISTLKIDNDKISRPVVLNDNLYLVKENAIIKLN